MRKFNIIVCLMICIASVFAGCVSTLPTPVDSSDRNAIALIVLCDMIPKVDQTGALIRFVDLPLNQIDQLKKQYGSSYQIYTAEMSEYTDKRKPSLQGIPNGVMHLKNSDREGVVLQVEIKEIREGDAEVIGTYQSSLSVRGDRYRLKRVSGVWRIISVEHYFAS